MSRLFTPEDYAILTLYLSVTGVFVLIASGRLEVAIPLASTAFAAKRLIVLSIVFACVTSSILLIVIASSRGKILLWLNVKNESMWLWLTPIGVFIAVLFQIISYWCTRSDLYGKLAITKIVMALGCIILPIALALYSPLSGGNSLVFGCLVASIIAVSTPNIRELSRVWRFVMSSQCSIGELKRTLSLNRDFPKHVFSTAFINGISKVAIFVSLQIFFGQHWAGLLALTERVVLTPLRVAATSLWQVTHASLANLSDSHKKNVFEKVHYLVCVGFGFPLSFAVSLSGYSSDFFGSQWHELELLLPAVCTMGYFNMISNSTSYFTAFGFFQAESIVNVGLVLARFSAIAAGVAFLDASGTVLVFCGVSAVAYLLVNAFWGCRLDCLFVFFKNVLLGGVAPALFFWVISNSEIYRPLVVGGFTIYLFLAFKGFKNLRTAVDGHASQECLPSNS
jgi:hypothetical protein